MATNKYIFIIGAPGSKWSSVTKNIYYSPDVDNSDYSDARTYHHDATGKMELMHLGAYFDPGMEFGDFFDKLDQHTKEECEAEFDRAFDVNDRGVRIVKSHVFANHIDFIKKTWPECPIVLCYRNNDECLGWWVKCGQFDITYPLYHSYYKDLRTMASIIAKQNTGILKADSIYKTKYPNNNLELCQVLDIRPPQNYFQDYATANIKVTVI